MPPEKVPQVFRVCVSDKCSPRFRKARLSLYKLLTASVYEKIPFDVWVQKLIRSGLQERYFFHPTDPWGNYSKVVKSMSSPDGNFNKLNFLFNAHLTLGGQNGRFLPAAFTSKDAFPLICESLNALNSLK